MSTMVIALGVTISASAAGPTVTTPDGRPLEWSGWIDDNAPVAVLLWASWVPGADTTLTDLGGIRTAVRDRGLDLVVVVLQEPIEEAKESLEGVDITWFHDRYGHLLKDYRVVSIPRILVIDEEGRVVERLDATTASVRSRGGE